MSDLERWTGSGIVQALMGIAFNRDFEPDYGQIIQLAPGVRRVVAKNPNPFTFMGTGVYIIGEGEVAVIDPGPSVDEHLDAVLAGLNPGETVSHILVTHTHSDHTAGVAKLQERTGAATYGFGPHGPVPDKDPMEQISFDEYFSAEEKATIEKEWADIPDELKREGPDVDFVPDVTVAHGDMISGSSGSSGGGRSGGGSSGGENLGGGWSVEVVHTPGHTSNHICFGLPDQKILFTGDHVMGWATSVIAVPDGNLFDYMSSLRLLLDRDDVRYWPTHGPAIDQPHDYVRSFIEHRNGRENQILAALHAGPITIKDLVPSMYVDTDKRLWRAAASSVFSHLHALHQEGRVAASDVPGGGVSGSGVSGSDVSGSGGPSLNATWTLV